MTIMVINDGGHVSAHKPSLVLHQDLIIQTMSANLPNRGQKVENDKPLCKCTNCHCPNNVKYNDNKEATKVATDKTTNARQG
jgi:hypothetical protein